MQQKLSWFGRLVHQDNYAREKGPPGNKIAHVMNHGPMVNCLSIQNSTTKSLFFYYLFAPPKKPEHRPSIDSWVYFEFF